MKTKFDRLWAVFVAALGIAALLFSSQVYGQVSLGGSGTGSGPMKRGNFLKPEQYATQAAMALYVDGSGSGNDGYTCADPATPCATIPGAVNKIPFLVQHPVDVWIDGGSYGGLTLVNHTFAAANTTNGAYINIHGAPQDTFDAGTGPMTGTVSAVSTDAVGFHIISSGPLADAGFWANNDLSTRFLTLTGGTGAGQILPIISNDAGVLTVSGTFSPAPVAASTTYAITTPSTLITTGINQPAVIGVAAGIARGVIIANDFPQRNAGNVQPTIQVSDIEMGTSTLGALIYNARAQFTRMRGASTLSSFAGVSGVGALSVSACTVSSSSTTFSTSTNSSSAAGLANGGGLFFTNSYILSTFIPVQSLGRFDSVGISSSQIQTSGATASAVQGGQGGAAAISIVGSRLRCGLNGTSRGLDLRAGTRSVAYVSGATSIENCIEGVHVESGGLAQLDSVSSVLLSNTTAVSAVGGGRIAFTTAVPTFTTNTTDISVDGATYTRAAFVALTPNSVVDMNYLSAVYLQP